jgi:RHS repeat-associated protein
LRTDYTGATAASYFSLPFADGTTQTVSAPGPNQDNSSFASLEMDQESGTSHAQFRQYSPAQGRWMSPDPYSGSYDFSNPQSFNRYSYAGNSPVTSVDPSGLDSYPIAESFYDAGGGAFADPDPTPPDPPDPLLTQPFLIKILVLSSYTNVNPLVDSPNAFLVQGLHPLLPSAPNNQSAWTQQKVKQFAVHFACKNSPQDRILKSIESGAVVGAFRVGVVGTLTGSFAAGVGAVPGAIIGGFIGGVTGAAGGVLKGAAIAGVCSAFAVYGGG